MPGSIYGLFVGINAYRDELRPLGFCNADAEALHRILGNTGSSKLLTDPDDRRTAPLSVGEIVKALEQYSIQHFADDDVFLFYFAGHGACLHGHTYLLTAESQISSDLALQHTALSINSLKEYLNKIAASKHVIILDVCRNDPSSNIRSAVGNKMDGGMAESLTTLKAPSRAIHPDSEDQFFVSRAIISACWQGQQSWEYSQRGHGWFTYHLLAHLKQTKEFELDVASLVVAVNKRMKENTDAFPSARRQRAHCDFSGDQILIPFTPLDKESDNEDKDDQEGEGKKGKIQRPELLPVAALNRQFSFQQQPAAMRGPYLRVESLEQPGRELFYRKKDKQLAIRVPNEGSGTVLIDQFATTNAQFCDCLNELTEKRAAWNEEIALFGKERVWCCESEKGILAADALGFWRAKSNSKKPPLYCACLPWGICYDQGWRPLHGSELLPATLVTWHGADAYGRWAHDHMAGKPGLYLPLEDVWKSAARTETRGLTVSSLNFAEHWAARELPTMKEVEQYWEKQPSVFLQARPLPVADFVESASSCGGVQFLGNVWEWCRDVRDQQKRVLKGGCCYSPREQCNIEFSDAVNETRLDPYVGFRCAFGEKEA